MRGVHKPFPRTNYQQMAYFMALATPFPTTLDTDVKIKNKKQLFTNTDHLYLQPK